MIVIDSDGDEKSNKIIKEEKDRSDSFNVTRCRATKRNRSYKEEDDDEDEDSSDDFMIDVESPPRKFSSSSSSSSSSSFAFPTKSNSLPYEKSSVTDRWIAVDTTSFPSSFSGLQAMILISSSA